MSALDDQINSLSSDELDILNNDPKMLTDFKNKYSQPTQSNFALDAMKQGVSSALPSPLAFTPLQPTSTNPVLGAVETAGQTLRDPTRISPTISQPGQVLGEKVQNQFTDPNSFRAKATGLLTSALTDPQTYVGMEGTKPLVKDVMNSASPIGKQISKLQEVLTAVDDNNFRELFNNPRKILSASSSKESGKIFQQAKQAAGLTEADERAIATKEDFRKSVYNDVMNKIDSYLSKKPTQEQQGRNFLAGPPTPQEGAPVQGMGGNELAPLQSPKVEVYSKGIMGKGTPNEMNLWGVKGDPQEIAKLGYGTDPASIPESVLRTKGISLPTDKPDFSVSDLLKAKKAGQLMAKSDPSTSGFFNNEIHTKINPLLKEMAPAVYDAQQAVHLSKVKESLLSLFPQGKGIMNYFRTISMLGGSLFHGVGALESPLIQTGLTVGAKGATNIAQSTPARFLGSAGLLRLANNPQLQSLRDRLLNAQNGQQNQ